jgi:uncharacterized protein (TIGR02145 family)
MKKITMKKLSLVSSLSSLVLLMACGDDVTNESVVKAESYESKADLPECGEKYEGKFATIPSKGEVYMCAEGKWNSLLSKAAISEDGEFACSTVELANKTGYKVVCGGDSVAVVKNGAKGEAGDKGEKGPDGLVGEKGSDGSGSDGRDLTLGKNDCAVLNSGADYVVYDCGDSVYVKNVSGYKADFYTWNAIESAKDNDYGDLWDFNIDVYRGHWSGLYNDRFGDKATGAMERWEGDKTWKNGDAWNLSFVADYHAYEGKALLTLTENIETSVADYRPYVGIRLAFGTMSTSDYGGTGNDLTTYQGSYDISSWGGVCLTYSSEMEMNILLKNGAKFVMATVPASKGKDATVNIMTSAFATLEGASYTADEVVQSVDTVTVELLGSNEKGEYTNNFALYEFGAYNRCAGYTKNTVLAEVKARKGKTGSFKDSRDGKTYKTVTIKGKVWMAQNLDYDYKVHKDPLHDGDEEDPDFECDDTHPCVERLVYEYADQDQAKLFGRLYSWAAAIDSASLARAETPLTCGTGTTCTLPTKVQGICPPDWRLPSFKEFLELAESACDSMFNVYCLTQEALFSTDGWNSEKNAGENWLGISLYPSGWYNFETSTEGQAGSGAFYWTASESSNANAYYHSGWGYSTITKQRALAVRCIQDEAK